MSSETENTDLEIIKEWLNKQHHLPQNIDKALINRFLHTCKDSIEQTKSLIDLFYTIRAQTPEIFSNRDPASAEIQEIFKNFDFVPMPTLTKNNDKIFVYHIKSPDPDKYHFINALKAFFIFADVRMVIEKEIPNGEIPIFDMTNFTMKHLPKINLSVLKKYMIYTQEAHPINLKEIHLLNAPPFLDRCMHMVRPFMKTEVGKMIHTHLPHSETLYDYVSKDLLPEEYGGTAGKICDIKAWWLKKIMEHRDYIIDETRWRVDESKRPANNNNSAKAMFGLEGSFRSLAID